MAKLIAKDRNDYLQGDNGDDIYEFSENFGKDIINNFHTNKSDKDIIKFIDNTTKDELNFAKHNDDLIINKILQNSINGSNMDNSNQIIIKDFFKDDTNLSYTFSEINFANSDKISSEQIVYITPTNSNDTIKNTIKFNQILIENIYNFGIYKFAVWKGLKWEFF